MSDVIITVSGDEVVPLIHITVDENSAQAAADSAEEAKQALEDLIASGNGVAAEYSKMVYVNSDNPATATIFDTENPPITNHDDLKNNADNLYIDIEATTWVYKTTPAGYETKEIKNNLGTLIVTAPEKTTIHDNDKIGIANVEDSNKTYFWKWSTIKAVLKTYFDSIYSQKGQKNITGNVTLDNTYDGKIVKVKATATITVPSTLIADFSAVFDCWTGATATFVAGSGATIIETALILPPNKMATLYKDGSTTAHKLKGETTP